MILYPYSLALNTPLRFQGQALSQRQGLLVKLVQDDRVGWGDCAPLPGFSRESLAQCQDALMAVAQGQTGPDSLPPAARFAYDCAQWQLTREGRLTLPPTVPLLSGTPTQQLAQFDALTEVPSQLKLKLARAPLREELDLVFALLARHPKLKLRIDANRGWDYASAAEFALAVPRENLLYVEEPCATLVDSLRLHQQYRLPLALDETTQASDYEYESLPGVKALVLKPTLIGSLARLQALTEAATLDGVTVVLSSSFESNVGLTQLAWLAQTLTPNSLPGLDTLSALEADLVSANPWGQPKPLIPEAELNAL
ncbi:o-succinylbenzoate synthase [Ferrimonas balearica]|uniref:o-succinylbenzoate synthase n=1 Tax=Ferrimonas balearica TaxID=44012 RepID=UPI001C9A2257|nr:o-succinylbenzoate synthase [Ferrimonas balearica]MBY5994174.1 o-succinylbenzoate synthase [Ferrimonas balearica]